MRKNEFLKALDRSLRALKGDERARSVAYYAELIDDKIEAGTGEEAAVAELGDPGAVANSILADAREQGALRPKRSPLTVALLIIGSPVWISILAAIFAVLLAVYVTVWAVILCAYALEVSLIAVLPASIVYFAVNASGNMPFCLFVLGLGLACAAAALACWRPIRCLTAKLAAFSASLFRKMTAKLHLKGRTQP